LAGASEVREGCGRMDHQECQEPGITMIRIEVRYFAALREQAGRSDESRETSASTAAGLYAELAATYGFRLAADRVRVAINEKYEAMDTGLKAGDEVVFIPPVSGG
jgi:molybdopterin converting factor subunit 1